MKIYKEYEFKLFDEEILNSFLQSLCKNEKLSDKTIKQYYNSILDFDLYLSFVYSSWDFIKDNDYELFSKILKRMNVTNRGIKSRISQVKRFKEYYDINKIER